MSTAIERAKADIMAGHLWQARDRLNSYLCVWHDADVLELLAIVHSGMGNLPAAGGLFHVLGRDDDEARRCIDAWKKRHGSAAAQLRSLPRQVREDISFPPVLALWRTRLESEPEQRAYFESVVDPRRFRRLASKLGRRAV